MSFSGQKQPTCHIIEIFGPGGGDYFSTSRNFQNNVTRIFSVYGSFSLYQKVSRSSSWSPSLHPSPCPRLGNLGRGLVPPPSTLTGVLMSPESAEALGSWSPQPAPSVVPLPLLFPPLLPSPFPSSLPLQVQPLLLGLILREGCFSPLSPFNPNSVKPEMISQFENAYGKAEVLPRLGSKRKGRKVRVDH